MNTYNKQKQNLLIKAQKQNKIITQYKVPAHTEIAKNKKADSLSKRKKCSMSEIIYNQ